MRSKWTVLNLAVLMVSAVVIIVYLIMVNANTLDLHYTLNTLSGNASELNDVVFRGIRVNSTYDVREILVHGSNTSVKRITKFDAKREASKVVLQNKEVFRGRSNYNNVYETDKYILYFNEQNQGAQIQDLIIKNRVSGIAVTVKITPPMVENLANTVFGGISVYNNNAILLMVGKTMSSQESLPTDTVLAVYFVSLDKGQVYDRQMFNLMTKNEAIGFKLPFSNRYSSVKNTGIAVVPLYPFIYSEDENILSEGFGGVKPKLFMYNYYEKEFYDLDLPDFVVIDDSTFLINSLDGSHVSHIITGQELYSINQETGQLESTIILERASKPEIYFKFIDKALIKGNKIYMIQHARNDNGFEIRITANDIYTGKLLFEGSLTSNDSTSDIWFQQSKELKDLSIEAII